MFGVGLLAGFEMNRTVFLDDWGWLFDRTVFLDFRGLVVGWKWDEQDSVLGCWGWFVDRI